MGSICPQDQRHRKRWRWRGEVTSRTQYFPAFFFFSTSSASVEYPGAITPSETSLEMIFAVARSHGADRAMKSPNEDIRSAPTSRQSDLRQCHFQFERLTSCPGVCTSKCCKRLFQVFDPIDLFLGLVQLDTHCSTGRRNVLERSSRREVQCLLKLLYQRIRVERVQEINVPRRST